MRCLEHQPNFQANGCVFQREFKIVVDQEIGLLIYLNVKQTSALRITMLVEEGETMKPISMLDDSTSRRTRWKFLFTALILICLLSSLSLAADEEIPKAVRRASTEGASINHQKRIALVIGNNEYKEDRLRNPAHDAEDIGKVLRELGFTVQTKINANPQEMEEAVKEFVREIQNGDVGLFYFSGHGVQVDGENYLIPVGVSIESAPAVRHKAISAGYILEEMHEARNRTNIFILDACRNNPFKGFRSMNKGLATMDAPKGTFIAYATAPKSVAADGTDRNSPYTKNLMQAIKSKGVPIEQVFKQVSRAVDQETAGKQIPWTASSLQDDFWFNPGDNFLPVPEPRRATASPGSQPSLDYKERLEKEKQELLARVSPPKPAAVPSSEYNKKGDDYYWGRGVPKDYDEAAKWYKKAAEQGNAAAQDRLAGMYMHGFGVGKDYEESVKWYKKVSRTRACR